MYSGSTLTTNSGRILGAHQKIDRTARRHLTKLQLGNSFPTIKSILYFEGDNGPDAIKRKSPAKDEPWHYFQPFDNQDTEILNIIQEHYDLLTTALRTKNTVRAAFEAAWLSHAIVDGLTPAHHYPYEEELSVLRMGASRDSRTTIKEKLVMHGDSWHETLSNNWKMWGPKGLFTAHGAFEWGVATVILPLNLKSAMPTEADIANFDRRGLANWYRITAQQIATLDLYDSFLAQGWTPHLARLVRRDLAPLIVRSVTLAWYGALRAADIPAKKRRSKPTKP